MPDPMTGQWERLDESPAASAQMIKWHAPETYFALVESALFSMQDNEGLLFRLRRSHNVDPKASRQWLEGLADAYLDEHRATRVAPPGGPDA